MVIEVAKKILIVENDADCRRALGRLVRRLGYESVDAVSGEEAIEQALVAEPELILINLSLPCMSGIELTLRLKQNPKALYIPVIVYSDGTDTREAAVKAGAALVIDRPRTYGALKKAVGIVLKRP